VAIDTKLDKIGFSIISQGTEEVAGKRRDCNAVHRGGKPLGERVLREFQRDAAGRVIERGNFLLAEGGADRHREMAGGIQYAASALRAGLQTAGGL
jgi:hypothetical protein